MRELCHIKEQTKNQAVYSWTSFWRKFKHVFIVAAHMSKWLALKGETLDHCLNGANVYYHSVRGFADGNFMQKAMPMCDHACAIKLGHPNIKM